MFCDHYPGRVARVLGIATLVGSLLSGCTTQDKTIRVNRDTLPQRFYGVLSEPLKVGESEMTRINICQADPSDPLVEDNITATMTATTWLTPKQAQRTRLQFNDGSSESCEQPADIVGDTPSNPTNVYELFTDKNHIIIRAIPHQKAA